MTFGSHEKVLGHKCMEITVEKIVAEEIIYHKENDSGYIPEMLINKKNIAKKRGINQVENYVTKTTNVQKSPGSAAIPKQNGRLRYALTYNAASQQSSILWEQIRTNKKYGVLPPLRTKM